MVADAGIILKVSPLTWHLGWLLLGPHGLEHQQVGSSCGLELLYSMVAVFQEECPKRAKKDATLPDDLVSDVTQ